MHMHAYVHIHTLVLCHLPPSTLPSLSSSTAPSHTHTHTQVARYPLQLEPMTKFKYYEEREKFDPTSYLKNPMVCVFVYKHKYLLQIFIGANFNLQVFNCRQLWVYICACVHVCTYVYVYIYVGVCVVSWCNFICMYICIYIYTHTYIYVYTHKFVDQYK